jgi:host factor-I protein
MVMVYLVNGAKLSGRIRSFDKFSILLESGPHEQLIFKHAISTISLSKRTSGELRAAAASDDASSQPTHSNLQPADSPES